MVLALLCLVPTVGALNVQVPVGGDIQAAIDEVSASGGGAVVLAAGVHQISESIKLRSRVALGGRDGTETTLRTDKAIKMLVQGAEGMHDVSIRNLQIVGVTEDGSHAIHFVSYRRVLRNIRLLGVRASRTGWGVHIKGADGILIEDCVFTGNGAKGREGYAHNLYLRRCENAVVRHTKLNGSISGNGCNISYSHNVTIDRCEARDNYFRGIRTADTDGCIVKHCTIGGNGNVGLLANREKEAARNVEFVGNTVFDNDGGGIQTRRGVTGRVLVCSSFNNRKFDFDLNKEVQQGGNRTAEVPVEPVQTSPR